MSEFDTAPRRPAFEREHKVWHAFERYGWCAPAEAEVAEAQSRVSTVLQAEALLPPGYHVVYDTTPVHRPLSADVAREWRAKGQDR